jgi:ArsR family transcriptional regulator
MTLLPFYKCLADDTRLRCLLLILTENELCVCELIAALEESQPKISRHLALLREAGILVDRRQGQWVFYRLNPRLPEWATQILSLSVNHHQDIIAADRKRLKKMGSRPERKQHCC